MDQNSGVLNDKLHWYKDAIIYELHIKAFKDGNNDGIGDFKGIIEKLDYIKELGVTAIWVLPFYPSPLKDDGYDIADYYNINPSYGTLENFKLFLEEAHKRDLKVITELVINHTSDQHPWFQRARIAPKGSKERNYYVWTDNPKQYKDVRIIFQDFETSNWSWDSKAQQYYWHRFFHHQPDLNYDSPDVREEVMRIVDYWCDLGVDGFRLDAVPYLFEREGTNGENLPETHQFLKELRRHIDEKYPATVFLAEANMWPEDSASYFGNGDECHMNYHFPVMPRLFMALQREDRYPITDIFDQTPEIPETCQWAMFLRNHDELTLEMVTDEERDYMYKAYAKDPRARINLGIRHRLAPLMENNRMKIELMNALLFSLPGTPVIYYGDEIGMGDNFYLGDRDGVRTPMQWSPDRNAGFSGANPQQLYLPVILDPEYNYEAVNVETQRKNTSSLFWFMKRMMNLRKKYKAFGRGDLKFIQVENPKVLAFTRNYQEQTILVVVNLSKFSQPAEILLKNYAGYTPVELFSRNKFPAIKESSPYFFTLGAHSFQWFALQKPVANVSDPSNLPTYTLKDQGEITSREFISDLENNILPDYLLKTEWFRGKQRKIYSCAITNQSTFKIQENNIFLFLVLVIYESGSSEFYQLPVTWLNEEIKTDEHQKFPGSIIANITVADKPGILYDAFYNSELQLYLIKQLAANSTVHDIVFNSNEPVKDFVSHQDQIISKIHSSDLLNTSISYENKFLLKMYRRVEAGINPDVEITRYLTEHTSFNHLPEYYGSVKWNQSLDNMVIGMMQPMIENHGDGAGFMKERVNNFIERILSSDRTKINTRELMGKLTAPAGYDELPEELQLLIGNSASEMSSLLGSRTAEMHLVLAEETTNKDFNREEFSLHYQRSLFSSMQSVVREIYQHIDSLNNQVSAPGNSGIEELINRKNDILNLLRKIYSKKFDIIRTRIHGSFYLGNILLTGKDISIQNFGGDPYRNYSEQRIKRSPLFDVAFMIRSFYHVAYDVFSASTHIPKTDFNQLMPFSWLWAFYISGFFMKSYLRGVAGSRIIPEDKNDLEMLVQVFLLERALYALNYELQNRPAKAIVPLTMINSVLNSK